MLLDNHSLIISTKLNRLRAAEDLALRSRLLEQLNRFGKRPFTTLTGQVTDQAALMGILNHLYDLQLPLISVEYLFEE